MNPIFCIMEIFVEVEGQMNAQFSHSEIICKLCKHLRPRRYLSTANLTGFKMCRECLWWSFVKCKAVVAGTIEVLCKGFSALSRHFSPRRRVAAAIQKISKIHFFCCRFWCLERLGFVSFNWVSFWNSGPGLIETSFSFTPNLAMVYLGKTDDASLTDPNRVRTKDWEGDDDLHKCSTSMVHLILEDCCTVL